MEADFAEKVLTNYKLRFVIIKDRKCKAMSATGHLVLEGREMLRFPRSLTVGSQMAASLSALRTGRRFNLEKVAFFI
jgi:hypothetical protein